MVQHDFAPSDSVCLFFGQSDTHAPTFRDRKTGVEKINSHPSAGQPYGSIDGKGIVALLSAPAAKPKESASAIIPSRLISPLARNHALQHSAGRFIWSCYDIDKGNRSLDDVRSNFEAVFPGTTKLIYSSSSATADDKRWRVLMPMLEVSGEDFQKIQKAAFALIEQNGLQLDEALARCGQPVYLPNVPPSKRDQDGKPFFYQHALIQAAKLDAKSHAGIQACIHRADQREKAMREEANAQRLRAERKRAERTERYGQNQSLIDHFNETHSLEDLMLEYGYEHLGGPHYASPNSQSKGSAVRVWDGEQWSSLTSGDAEIGQKGDVGTWGDAFDLYVHYEHNGDFDAAVRAYGAEINPAKAAASEMPENGMDDFDYVEPKAASEAPASAPDGDDDDGSWDIPDPPEDAPEAAPDWPSVYDMFDEASIEPRKWIYGHHYLRSFVSVLASAGGIGKTSLQIVEALAIVTGRPLLGEEVKERTNVWIVNLEDPLEEIQRRVLASMRHYGINKSEVEGRLFVNAGRDFSLKFGIQTRDGVLPNAKLVEYLCKKIPEKQIGCVFIDPFVGAHSINENDNMAVNAIVAEIRSVADETKSAIGLVHHIRKGNGEDASIDSVRGAGSLIGAARAARVINRMSADDAAKLGIDEAEARSIFRVDDGKANLAPPAASAVYRKMEGVKIDNGEWIGVCIPYTLPDAFDDISGKDAKAAQKIVANAHTDGEPLRESSQSKNWVGVPIADMLGIDISEKKGKAKVSSIVKMWIKTNVLAVERITDPKKARDVPVIVVGEWINGDEV